MFTLRVPVSGMPNVRSTSEVVSSHSSLDKARRALSRYHATAERRGEACEAFIWDDDNGEAAERHKTR